MGGGAVWPFESRYLQHIDAFAPLLDAVFVEAIGKLDGAGKAQFVRLLRADHNAESVNDQDISGNQVFWRDKRLNGFMFSADFGFSWWGLSATADATDTKPSYVGIMLTATGAEPGAKQEKCVSVENYIAVKATSAAEALAQLLSSRFGYRRLT